MNLAIFILFLTLVVCFKHVESRVVEKETPRNRETGALTLEEPRKKQQNSLMSRILPMLATPFIMQVTILPLVLMGMKFMLLNSMLLGKLGVFLWIFHLIRKRNDVGGGLYSHNVNVNHNDYPGHSYDDKNYMYSAHYNYRRRKRSHVDKP